MTKVTDLHGHTVSEGSLSDPSMTKVTDLHGHTVSECD